MTVRQTRMSLLFLCLDTPPPINLLINLWQSATPLHAILRSAAHLLQMSCRCWKRSWWLIKFSPELPEHNVHVLPHLSGSCTDPAVDRLRQEEEHSVCTLRSRFKIQPRVINSFLILICASGNLQAAQLFQDLHVVLITSA